MVNFQEVKGWSSDVMYDRLANSQQVVKGWSSDKMYDRLGNSQQGKGWLSDVMKIGRSSGS